MALASTAAVDRWQQLQQSAVEVATAQRAVRVIATTKFLTIIAFTITGGDYDSNSTCTVTGDSDGANKI